MTGSKDGSGAGDHDALYHWGRHPTHYMPPRLALRVIALRGLVQDARAGLPSPLYHLDAALDFGPSTEDVAS